MNKKIILFIVFIIILLILALFRKDINMPFFSFSPKEDDKIISKGTIISGEINGERVLLKTESPYLLTENLVVKENGFLKIEPGVYIYVTPGRKIEIKGKVLSSGQKQDKIIFELNSKKPEKNSWGGIHIKSSNENLIENTEIKNASLAFNLYPLSRIKILNSVIKKNGQGIFSNGANVEIKQNIFEENNIGVFLEKTSGSISENIFIKNNLCVFLSWENNVSINNNVFKKDNNSFLSLESEKDFYFAGNYFDAQNIEEISRKIFDGNDKNTFQKGFSVLKRGFVIFQPILSQDKLNF